MARNTKLLGSFITLSVCISLLPAAMQSASAGAERISNKQVAAATSPKDSAPAAAPATTGNTGGAAAIVATLKTEQQQLRRMGEAVKRTKRASGDLQMECTQPVEMMGEIDIIGQDVIPIMPATAEGFGNQHMPPRPKYINLHMAQLAALVPILQEDISSLTIPDVEKDAAAGPLEDLQGNMDDLNKHYARLVEITKDKVDYNVQELMSAARGIDSCCKGIDMARKKLLHEDTKLEKVEEKAEKDEAKKK